MNSPGPVGGDSDAGPPASLAGGALRGAGWNIVTFGLSKALLLVTTVVLTRVLQPSDFGLLALGLLVVVFLEVIGDLGVGAAVIYRRHANERSTSTAVLMAALTGSSLALVCVLGAPLIAGAFEEPRLTGVIRVLAIGLLLRSLSTVHRAMLEKELNFARRAVPEVLGAVTKTGLSIALALGGAGVYSLAWGQVAGLAVTTLLYWGLARWRFRPSFDVAVARELLRFGLPVTVLALLAGVTQSLDQLIVGHRLDAAALGQYAIAYRLPELLVMQFCYLLSGALFPSYARASGDPDRLRRGFRSTLRLVSLVTAPVALGLTVVSADIVPLLFGPQWTDAVPVMRWLAVATLLLSLSFNVGDIYKATGRPGILNWLTGARLLVSVPVLWWAAPAGITAVAAALAGICAAHTLLQLTVASALMRVRLRSLLLEFWPAGAAGGAMTLVLWGATAVLADVAPLWRLAVLVPLGALVYVAALTIVSRRTVREVLQLLRAARGDSPARSAADSAPVTSS